MLFGGFGFCSSSIIETVVLNYPLSFYLVLLCSCHVVTSMTNESIWLKRALLEVSAVCVHYHRTSSQLCRALLSLIYAANARASFSRAWLAFSGQDKLRKSHEMGKLNPNSRRQSNEMEHQLINCPQILCWGKEKSKTKESWVFIMCLMMRIIFSQLCRGITASALTIKWKACIIDALFIRPPFDRYFDERPIIARNRMQ